MRVVFTRPKRESATANFGVISVLRRQFNRSNNVVSHHGACIDGARLRVIRLRVILLAASRQFADDSDVSQTYSHLRAFATGARGSFDLLYTIRSLMHSQDWSKLL